MSAAEELCSTPTISTAGPGVVLAELHLRDAIGKGPLFAGLKAMGFTAVTVAFVKKKADSRPLAADIRDPAEPAMQVRFLGKLAHAIAPTDTEVIRWTAFEPVRVDPFRRVTDLSDVPVIPFMLETGALYEARFVARVKAHPNADDVADALEDMGFEVAELIHLSDSEDRTGNLSVWFGRFVWASTLSVVTPEDPFYFEQLVKIAEAKR